ncbi:MAG TPA: CdaR family protein [Blastocatellia bacterium]|nr:CdaR family protein [Blastocatellia bacterium]
MKRRDPARLFHRLRHTRIENKGLKSLSLLLAVLLFIVSRQPVIDLRMVGVPIEYRGLSPGVKIVGDAEQTVSVRLSGPRDIVRSLAPNQLLVIADLSGKEPGERVVQLKVDESLLPDNVKVMQIEPPSIRIKLEPNVAKRVRVEANLIGSVAEGREFYGVALYPGEVEIEGPRSIVDKMERVLTEKVSLDGRGADFQTSVEVDIPQDSLRVKTPGRIELSVKIGEERLVRRFANAPVQWIDKSATGWLLTKTVLIEVSGPKSAVEALRPDDLRVEVKTASLPPEVTSVTPQVQLPANIEIRKIIPREVKVKR